MVREKQAQSCICVEIGTTWKSLAAEPLQPSGLCKMGHWKCVSRMKGKESLLILGVLAPWAQI